MSDKQRSDKYEQAIRELFRLRDVTFMATSHDFERMTKAINVLYEAGKAPRPDTSPKLAQVREHDFPILQEFYSKYAIGGKLPPSCLVCGHSQPDRETWAIQHMELPGIIVCRACTTLVRPVTRPSEDVMEVLIEAKAWLDVAADSGIASRDEVNLPTPNAERCVLLSARISGILARPTTASPNESSYKEKPYNSFDTPPPSSVGPTLEQVADHLCRYFNEKAQQWREAAADWQKRGDKEQAERHRTMGAWFANQATLAPSEVLGLASSADQVAEEWWKAACPYATPQALKEALASFSVADTVAIPRDRLPRLKELVGSACRKAAVDNDERAYELWTAVRRELDDAEPSATRPHDCSKCGMEVEANATVTKCDIAGCPEVRK